MSDLFKSSSENYEEALTSIREERLIMWTYMVISIVYMRVSMDLAIEGDLVQSVPLFVFTPISIILSFVHRNRYRAKMGQYRFPGTFFLPENPTVHLSGVKTRRFHLVDKDGMMEKSKASEEEIRKIFEDANGQD